MGAEMGKKLTVHLWNMYFLSQVFDSTSPSNVSVADKSAFMLYFNTQKLHKMEKTFSEISGNNQEKYRKYQTLILSS